MFHRHFPLAALKRKGTPPLQLLGCSSAQPALVLACEASVPKVSRCVWICAAQTGRLRLHRYGNVNFQRAPVKEAEFPPPRAARFVYDVRAVTLVIAEDGYSFSCII